MQAHEELVEGAVRISGGFGKAAVSSKNWKNYTRAASFMGKQSLHVEKLKISDTLA